MYRKRTVTQKTEIETETRTGVLTQADAETKKKKKVVRRRTYQLNFNAFFRDLE